MPENQTESNQLLSYNYVQKKNFEIRLPKKCEYERTIHVYSLIGGHKITLDGLTWR